MKRLKTTAIGFTATNVSDTSMASKNSLKRRLNRPNAKRAKTKFARQATSNARARSGTGELRREASPSATDAVVAFIKEGIRVGRLVPGQRLVERDLIESCAVSRSAIREALRTLAADGTIAIEHRRSAVVRQFSREEVWAQHQIREVLEGLAASLCATRVAQSGLQKELISLEKALADAAKRDDRDRYLKLNYQFHSLIAKLSGNPGIQEHLNRAMTTQVRLQAARFWNTEGMRQSHEEHKAIIESILSGDAERAESTMRRHIRGTRRILLEMPDSVFPVSHNFRGARLVDLVASGSVRR